MLEDWYLSINLAKKAINHSSEQRSIDEPSFAAKIFQTQDRLKQLKPEKHVILGRS